MNSIDRWSLANALVVLTAAAVAAWAQSILPLLGAGIGMLALLVLVKYRQWTARAGFGLANWITSGRVALLSLLPPAEATGAGPIVGLSLLILALDGIDGWVARDRDLTSEFGAFFDKETDSLFLLLLCGLAAFRGPLPTWILAAGLLRYGFVVLLFLVPTPETRESRSLLARYIYGFMIAALLAAFFPYPQLYEPLVAVATGALVLSFGRSLWETVGHSQITELS